MDWQRLLSSHRLGTERGTRRTVDPRSDFVRDWDRIIFSAAFRRMQDKTQVFPLAKNDYVRTRLTHSLEVASVGRSLGILAGQVILEEQKAQTNLPEMSPHDIGSIVAAACLAHDIGNPPFGHAGESAIQAWFAQHRGVLKGLTEVQQYDFLSFEGNAQGFRQVTALQHSPERGGMQLTAAVLGAFTKYPRASAVDADQEAGVSGRKFGFMHEEQGLFEELAEELGLLKKPGAGAAWLRHPLAFLVEAADDICYHIIDIEDGFKAGVIGFEELRALHEPWLDPKRQSRLQRLPRLQQAEYMRATTVGELINEATQVFRDRYAGLMDGSQDEELMQGIPHADAFQRFRGLAAERVYTARPVIEVLACGFEVLGGLLDAFVRAIRTHCGHREDMGEAQARTLLGLLPSEVSPNLSPAEQLLVVTDFVSGMTDSSALELYQRIRGIALP